MSSAAAASTAILSARAVERLIRRRTWLLAEHVKSEKCEAWSTELRECLRQGKMTVDEIEAWRPAELKRTEGA